jgi:hypothetical protein
MPDDRFVSLTGVALMIAGWLLIIPGSGMRQTGARSRKRWALVGSSMIAVGMFAVVQARY